MKQRDVVLVISFCIGVAEGEEKSDACFDKLHDDIKKEGYITNHINNGANVEIEISSPYPA